MATHSGILAWRIPTDRGAWWARKGSDMTEAAEHACIGKSESMKYQKR